MLSPTMTLFGTSCFLSSRFSSRNRLASIAFLIRIRVLSIESGFSRKSYAPSLVARTAVSMVPCPEIIMTSGAFSFSRIFSRVSRPSIPGNHTSSSTTSKVFLLMLSRPASPLSASEVLNPSSSSTPLSDWRMVGSSSTIRMLCMVDRGSSDRVRHNRQFHHKACAHGLIFFYADRTVMVFDNAVHNCQAQAGTALLGGEVGQEQPLLQFSRDAVAGVGNRDLHHIAGGHERSRNLDFAKHRVLHCFRGIVQQISQGSLDGFGVGHHVGQLGRERSPHADIVQTPVEHGESVIDDGINVGGLRRGSRETRQSRKLVDQRAHGFNSSGDGIGAAVDHLQRSSIRRRWALQMAADALRRKCNGRQWILDFMSYSSRHLTPGRLLLSLEQFGEIFEHQNVSQALSVVLESRYRN